jgi:NitT/TauT family transport system substrate-binding protein
VTIVLQQGPTLGEGHQRWQMNEVNALIWPAPLGIGVMDPDDFQHTAKIALDYDIIDRPASDAAYDTALAEAALQELRDEGVDVTGDDWKKPTVQVTPGGE